MTDLEKLDELRAKSMERESVISSTQEVQAYLVALANAHEEMATELRAARETIARLERDDANCRRWMQEGLAEIRSLAPATNESQRQLATIRAETIEECARVCEAIERHYPESCCDATAAIRALAGAGPPRDP